MWVRERREKEREIVREKKKQRETDREKAIERKRNGCVTYIYVYVTYVIINEKRIWRDINL